MVTGLGGLSLDNLKNLARTLLVAALVTWIVLPAPGRADTADDLQLGIDLFEQGDYLAAQEALVGLDRDRLTPDQQALRDDYLDRTMVAITMSEKAERDLEAADSAATAGENERAVRLLETVLANEYANERVQRDAEAKLRGMRGPADPPVPVAPAMAQVDDPEPAEPATPQPSPNGGRARALVDEGNEMLQAGRYEQARMRFEEALDVVPGYPEAVDGLRRIAEHETTIEGKAGETLLERIRTQDRINWQRTVAEYRDVERVIREHVVAERFEEARQLLVRGRQIVEAGKQFADPVAKYDSLRSEADALAEFVATQERLYNEHKVAEIRRQIEDERAARLREDEENRRRQVDALMKQAMQHRKDGDLDGAITVLRQVTVIDPKNETARWMLDELEDLRQYRRGREIRSDFADQSQRALQDVEEAKIPWHMELRYPDNWAELVTRPERTRTGETGPDRLLFGALDRQIPVDFDGDPFDTVIERLADAQRLNVIVNWRDLEQAGVDRTVPIELTLPNEITLKKALTEVLEQAGGSRVELGYTVGGGAIKIATRNTLDRETYTAVYDINDLLMEVPNFNDAPMTDLTKATARRTTDRPAADQTPWTSQGGDAQEQRAPDSDPQRAARVAKIIQLIRDTVEPDSWSEHGGSVGTIQEINGQLVITQNSSGQRQVGDLLGKLREQRAIQIAVEARFITVSSHYLEELGIDLDIVLNAGNAGFDYLPGVGGPATDPVLGSPLLLPRTFSRLGFTPNTPALGAALPSALPVGTVSQPYGQPVLVPAPGGGGGSQTTPVPVINRVISFTDPANLGSDVPGSFAGQTIGPALSLFGSFLDNIQVDFLIRATQADSRTTVLTAPRLVLFNGQRSWVAVTIQQSFVSQLNPVVATGAVAQAPQTDVINSGAVLDVQATVTADKRYVTLTLRPGVTRLLDLQTIPFSGGGAGGGFGGGPALQAFIQLPTLSTQRVQTTVSVPDGGTLLIGGQKLASETDVEAGVPILSKIPILKRAYSSRSMVKDEQTLLILIKPKILIQSEQEEQAYPTFGQR
jgi:type II secretory pathway component GspD/PulD (secretin)/tetratricopeptide (TPR) repeat protein